MKNLVLLKRWYPVVMIEVVVCDCNFLPEYGFGSSSLSSPPSIFHEFRNNLYKSHAIINFIINSLNAYFLDTQSQTTNDPT